MSALFVYSILFVCIFLLYKKRGEHDNRFYWLAAFLLSVLVGARSVSVPDTSNYLAFFRAITPGDFSTVGHFSFEIGFQVYTHLLKLLSLGSSFIYFTLISMTNLALLYWVARKISPADEDCNYLLLLLSYYAFFGFFYNAIVLRAGIAMSLVMLAVAMCYERGTVDRRTLLSATAVMALALSFHLSAVIGLVVLLVFIFSRPLKFELSMLIWLVLVIVLISHLSPQIIQLLLGTILAFFSLVSDNEFDKYAYYITELYELNPVVPNRIIFQFLIGLLFINVRHADDRYYKLLNVYLVGLFVSATCYSIEQLSRATDYFLIFSSWLFYLRFRETYNEKRVFLPLMAILFLQVLFFIRIINDAH